MPLMVALLATSFAGAVEYTTFEEKVMTGVVVPIEEGIDYDDVGGVLGDGGIMPLSSHSITSNYGVGTTNTALFTGLVSKFDYGVHYVYWRDGQYSYRLAYSRDLVFEGSRFTAPSVQIVTYYTYTGSGQQATWSTAADSNFSLSTGNYLVWSDLGDYPQLETGKGERDYVHAACIGVAFFVLFSLFRSMWHSIRGRLD